MDGGNQRAFFEEFFAPVAAEHSLVITYLKHSPLQGTRGFRLLVGAAHVTGVTLPPMWNPDGTAPFDSSMWKPSSPTACARRPRTPASCCPTSSWPPSPTAATTSRPLSPGPPKAATSPSPPSPNTSPTTPPWGPWPPCSGPPPPCPPSACPCRMRPWPG
jgi:hypothetical protein